MSVTLLNENQQRRLGTHLRLLTQDLEALAEVPDAQARTLIDEIGAVHPELASRLDPRIDELRRLLEALADAAQRLPER